jgi:8-oxo-dGTP pyrophosphatase MutT (NUDIX family)
MIIHHNGHPIEVTADASVDLGEAIESSMFKSWLASMDMENFEVPSVRFMSLYSMELHGAKKPLFLMLEATSLANGKKVPGVVFASDGAVTCLVVLKHKGKRLAVTVRQPRTPTGEVAFEELAAGILDGEGQFKCNMIREIKEELGIDVAASQLIDLSALAGHDRGFFPSPGRCNETIRCFCLEIEVDAAYMKFLQERETGLKEEGEYIRVNVVPLVDLYKCPDGKTLVALALYERFVCNKRGSKPRKSRTSR